MILEIMVSLINNIEYFNAYFHKLIWNNIIKTLNIKFLKFFKVIKFFMYF